MAYKHSEIEKKWQEKWEQGKAFQAEFPSQKPKFYALDMFPYPSGYGLHMGHLVSYTPTDIVARYKRACGFNVLHPMGWDAFGLPAEQHAIKTGIHPAETTRKTIDNFRRQLKSLGYSFDWDREVSTCDPNYYKWTQFIFLKLFEKGLAYQKEVPVNWCPELRTVLANDEVIDGKSERGGHPVVRKPMRQWLLKITEYADRLAKDLDSIDWPDRTKEGQRNWIGRSEGAKVKFIVEEQTERLEIFTTRPDTLFGVSFMVLAPEHPMVKSITTVEQTDKVKDYCEKAAKKSEIDRKACTEKTGVFTGGYALNPVNQEKIPIWIADYVLMDYGTGAIMAVPGHDARDFEFAQAFSLPILRVIESDNELPYEGKGNCVNSGFLDGLGKTEAISKMTDYLQSKGLGEKQIQYKLRDWTFSRQRYWGEPFPLIHTKEGIKAVPENELPVELPNVADYEPTEKGEPPLARVADWVEYESNTIQGQRDVDTMPGAAGSSWYFLRYCDPHNNKAFCDPEKEKYWMPVDLYVGGPEHTVGHLLYSRFWHKVLYDAGLVSHPEPFARMAHQGDLLGTDGYRMSKSRGNVVNLDNIVKDHGADAARTFVTFLGPMSRNKPWDSSGLDGVRRFLERVWRLVVDDQGNKLATDEEIPEPLDRLLHKTIKKVSEDIDSLDHNTAISAMMILTNEIYKQKSHSRKVLRPLIQMLAPFAPHVCEEMWEKIGEQSFVALAPWPQFDDQLVIDDLVTMGVQVNGKMRGKIELAKTAAQQSAVDKALEISAVKNAIGKKNIVKTIYVPGRILNLIAR